MRQRKQSFFAYLAKLEKNGFVKVYEKQIDNNRYAQYQKGDILVYTYYIAKSKEVRVIHDRSSNTSVKDFGYSYVKQPGDTTEFYQYNLNTAEDVTIYGWENWAANFHILKLADNSVMLFDSGEYYGMSEPEELAGIMNFLHQITGTDENTPVRVSLWFFSHAHGDHVGMSGNLMEAYHDQLDVERIMYNFSSYQTHANGYSYPEVELMRDAFHNYYPNAKYMKCFNGEAFRLADATVTVLFAHEDLTNPNTGASMFNGYCNEMSAILKVSTDDGMDIMYLGDMKDIDSYYNMPYKIFSGETVKADIVQAAHHAYNLLPAFYAAINAPICIVPAASYIGISNYESINQIRQYSSEVYFMEDATHGFKVVDGAITHFEIAPINRDFRIKLTPDMDRIDFANVSEDYEASDVAKDLTLTNNTQRTIEIKNIQFEGTNFKVDIPDDLILEPKMENTDSVQFKVYPVSGLSKGTYSDTLKIQLDAPILQNEKYMEIPVTLTVAEDEEPIPTPTEAPVEPTPTVKPAEPTPTEKPAEPTPTVEPAEPTPTVRPVEPTTAPMQPTSTPTQPTAKPTEAVTPKPSQKPENKVITAKALEEALEEGKDYTLSVTDENGRVRYSWTFAGKDLKNADGLSDINHELTVNRIEDHEKINTLMKGSNENGVGLVISFGHEGKLPTQATVQIYVGDIRGVEKNTNVFLYHYNPETGKLEELPYGSSYKVNEDGYITINIVHCSEYVVLPNKADGSITTSLGEQISVTASKKSMYVDQSAEIKVELPPTLVLVDRLDAKTVASAIGAVTASYKSSNTSVATVDSQGLVKAKKAGKVTITTKVKLYDGSIRTFTTKLTVEKPSINVTKKTAVMKVGDTFTFKAKGVGLKGNIEWTTKKKNVVVINKKTGKAVAKTAGTDYVVAKIGSTQVKIKVTVTK